jgi:hypothetical protein
MNYIMSGVKTPCMSFLHGTLTSGSAAGVGLHTNLRFASPNVQFALPECRMGFFPDGGTLWVCVRFYLCISVCFCVCLPEHALLCQRAGSFSSRIDVCIMIVRIYVSNTPTLNTVYCRSIVPPFDAGSTHLLSRMPGLTGMYLALTGHTLGMGDLLYTGLATHAVSLDEVAPLQQVRAEEDDTVERGMDSLGDCLGGREYKWRWRWSFIIEM